MPERGEAWAGWWEARTVAAGVRPCPWNQHAILTSLPPCIFLFTDLLVHLFGCFPSVPRVDIFLQRSPDLIAPVWLPDIIKRLRISTPGSLMESGVRCIVWKMPRILPLSYFRVKSCSIHPIFPSFWLCARGCDFPPVLCWGIDATWKCWSNLFIFVPDLNLKIQCLRMNV